MYALLITLLAILPVNDVLRESVDLIETNHFYDEYGRLVFDQVIFFDWCEPCERYQVRDWRLAKTPEILPRRDFARGGYVSLWIENSVVRSVSSANIRETWTQYDPELAERTILPAEQRRKLKAER